MSFVLKAIPDVVVEVPVQVPGETKASTIQARWKLHKWDDFQARVEQMRTQEMTDEELVAQDLIEIGGIKDENGKDREYSSELRDELMQMGFVRRPLMASWFEAQHGRTKAATKN